MRFLAWLLRIFVFFSLFAFSVNNQQGATLHWFFGYAWNAPMVIIVLGAFVVGLVVGVMAMAPSWWHQRGLARQSGALTDRPVIGAAATSTPESQGALPLDGI